VKPDGMFVQMGADTRATASPAERTIEGLAVPYGPVGQSAFGALTFSKGSLKFGAPGRVKLLKQHRPDDSLGFAKTLDDRDDGLYAVFSVPESPEGDVALSEAADGRRDGLSVGVQLDEEVISEVMEKWMNDDHSPTAASGRLLEVSQVSLPAFDDARIPSAAAAAGGVITMSVQFSSTPPEKEHTMPEVTTSPPAAVEAAAPPVELAAPTPSPFEGGFQTVSEPPVYTFDNNGPSFVRDMWRARFDQDPEAQARVQKFHAQFAAREPNQMRPFLQLAVETRATAPNFINQGYRPDLLREAIDKGRPLFSRLNVTTLTDATPFRLPTEGDFTGVGPHTEGTAHVAEGDLTMGDVVVTPGAVSGAYRLSRELIEASNPAIDTIALRAMLRNYRNVSEAQVVAALEASDSTATASINTAAELRAQIDAYWNLNFEAPSAIAASPSFVSTLLLEVDTTGRPMLPSVGPSNALGTTEAGGTGVSVDGVEIFKVWGIATNMAYLFRAEDVFVGESAIRTFRFEEVEGPGVVKLALFSYLAAAVTRPGSVVKLGSA